MFLKIDDTKSIVYPYNINLLRKDFPNTSFPNNMESQSVLLTDFGVHRVIESSCPEYDTFTQKATELQPILIEEEWTQHWEVQELTADEVQVVYDSHAAEVRANRYRLLVESDWTQFKDVSDDISNIYTLYRQELRDISKQAGFPFNIVWPAIP